MNTMAINQVKQSTPAEKYSCIGQRNLQFPRLCYLMTIGKYICPIR
jgi:hypothetical protein